MLSGQGLWWKIEPGCKEDWKFWGKGDNFII